MKCLKSGIAVRESTYERVLSPRAPSHTILPLAHINLGDGTASVDPQSEHAHGVPRVIRKDLIILAGGGDLRLLVFALDRVITTPLLAGVLQ